MASMTVVRVLVVILVTGFISATSAYESGIALFPMGSTFAFKEQRVLFMCNTNLSATYPQWAINGQLYHVTGLPNGFTAKEIYLLATFQTYMRISCLIKYHSNGKIHYSHSNTSSLFPLQKIENIRSLNGFPVCHEKNITLLIHSQVIKINLTVVPTNKACNYSVSLTNCANPLGIGTLIREELQSSQTKLQFNVNEIDQFYGSNVTVTINKECDDCRETRVYLPNLHTTEYISVPNGYTGTIIEDLSNKYCDFNSIIIDYKICLHTQESSHCFENLCGSEKVYATDCHGFHDSEMVGLAVNGVENGTVVSIYCIRPDCVDKPSYLMATNFIVIIESISTSGGPKEISTMVYIHNATTSVKIQGTTETMMGFSSEPHHIVKNTVSVAFNNKPALVHTSHLQYVYLACGVLIPLTLFVVLITTLVIILYRKKESNDTDTENVSPVYEEVTLAVRNSPDLLHNPAYSNTQRVQLKNNPAYLPVVI